MGDHGRHDVHPEFVDGSPILSPVAQPGDTSGLGHVFRTRNPIRLGDQNSLRL